MFIKLKIKEIKARGTIDGNDIDIEIVYDDEDEIYTININGKGHVFLANEVKVLADMSFMSFCN